MAFIYQYDLLKLSSKKEVGLNTQMPPEVFAQGQNISVSVISYAYLLLQYLVSLTSRRTKQYLSLVYLSFFFHFFPDCIGFWL